MKIVAKKGGITREQAIELAKEYRKLWEEKQAIDKEMKDIFKELLAYATQDYTLFDGSTHRLNNEFVLVWENKNEVLVDESKLDLYALLEHYPAFVSVKKDVKTAVALRDNAPNDYANLKELGISVEYREKIGLKLDW